MLTVSWSETAWRHASIGVSRLPEVFKVEDERFTIDAQGADAKGIRDVCAACPSAARRPALRCPSRVER